MGTTSTSISTLGLNYTYGTTNNNGNILSQIITAPNFTATQNYSYDQVNRITNLTEVGVGSQSYSYDQYGNRWVSGYIPNPTLTPQSQSAYNASTNRLIACGYDAAGNMTSDQAGASFSYDGENRQKSYNSGAATYHYDGDGRRVKKVVGTVTTLFVYNASGQMIAEYESPAPSSSGGTSYLTTDHLGSTRVVTDSAGLVKTRRDYLPFGEEIASSIGGRTAAGGYGQADGIDQKFTGYERDGESGLDFAQARYYSSVQGRFTSVDPLLESAELHVPQSWNRYTYTLNNPLKYTDPTGEKWAVQYDDGKALFRWYEGDTIPSEWGSGWQEYTAGWYIGSEEVVRLGTRGPDDFLVLTKDLFSNEDWAKLQGADPANLTNEQKEILFSGATYRIDQVETIRRMKFVAELGGYLIAGAVSTGRPAARLGPKTSVPPTPGGMTSAKFGQQVMKWGRSSAEARARIRTLSREELERAGVTKQIAKAWRNFYRQEAIRNPANPSAPGRADLMDRAVKLLKGK